MQRLPAIIVCVWLVSFAGAAQDGRLPPHERELLEAQVEALIGRLSRSRLADPLAQARRYSPPVTGLAIQATVTREQPVAGISLVHLSVSVSGRPEFLQLYLAQKHQAGFTLTPPLKIDRAGVRDRLELSLWCLRGKGLDSRSGDQALLKLRDNLVWLETQQKSAPVFLSIIQPVNQAETFRLDKFTWESNTLRLAPLQNSRAALKIFEEELRRRAARFPRSLRVIFEKSAPAVPPGISGPGLDLQDIDLADAVLMLSEVARLNVIFASRKPARLAGSFRGQRARDLLGQLLADLKVARDPQADIVVAAQELPHNPVAADMFSNEPISLRLLHAAPGYLFALLADVSRVGLVPPSPSELSITVLLRKQPVRRAAQAAMRALGLKPQGDRKLLAIVPADRPPAASAAADDPLVDLYTADAPLSLLLQELSGSKVTLTSELTMRLRRAPKNRLADLLLASRNTTAAKDDRTPASRQDSAGNRPDRPLRLAAVLREDRGSRALIENRGKFAWLSEGDKLGQGGSLRKIYSSRVLIKSPDGSRESLPLEPRQSESPAKAERQQRPDALGIALARLRLAGTVVLSEGSAAVLSAPDGNTFLVKPGHPLGRRCGKVTGVSPGTVTVELGCPNPFDSKKYELYMHRQIDSRPPGR